MDGRGQQRRGNARIRKMPGLTRSLAHAQRTRPGLAVRCPRWLKRQHPRWLDSIDGSTSGDWRWWRIAESLLLRAGEVEGDEWVECQEAVGETHTVALRFIGISTCYMHTIQNCFHWKDAGSRHLSPTLSISAVLWALQDWLLQQLYVVAQNPGFESHRAGMTRESSLMFCPRYMFSLRDDA